ncbi:MAG: hypothetical protein K0U79_08785 [Gammaproteobacteria bacterium]|nr:hypothetical protein [Gammaproteobacteria bacterium]
MLRLRIPRHYLDAQGLSLFAPARPSARAPQRRGAPDLGVNLLIAPTDAASDDGRLVRHVSAMVTRGAQAVTPRSIHIDARRLSPSPGAGFEIPAEPLAAEMLGQPVTRYGTEMPFAPGLYHMDIAIDDEVEAQFVAEIR